MEHRGELVEMLREIGRRGVVGSSGLITVGSVVAPDRCEILQALATNVRSAQVRSSQVLLSPSPDGGYDASSMREAGAGVLSLSFFSSFSFSQLYPRVTGLAPTALAAR